MTETNQNFDIYQGDSKQVTFTVRDENGAALALAGYTATWVLYKDRDKAATAVLSKTIGDGLAVPTPSNGKVILTLAPAATETLATGKYSHELEVVSGAGDVSTVTTGDVTVFYSKA
jgi:hypothetical protein